MKTISPGNEPDMRHDRGATGSCRATAISFILLGLLLLIGVAFSMSRLI